MGKIRQQKHCYKPLLDPRTQTAMDKYLTRPQSLALPALADLLAAMDLSLGVYDLGVGTSQAQDTQSTPEMSPQATQAVLTPELLDEKLQALLQQMTRNFAAEVGTLSQELRGEVVQIGEMTAAIGTKFDDLVKYVQELDILIEKLYIPTLTATRGPGK